MRIIKGSLLTFIVLGSILITLLLMLIIDEIDMALINVIMGYIWGCTVTYWLVGEKYE